MAASPLASSPLLGSDYSVNTLWSLFMPFLFPACMCRLAFHTSQCSVRGCGIRRAYTLPHLKARGLPLPPPCGRPRGLKLPICASAQLVISDSGLRRLFAETLGDVGQGLLLPRQPDSHPPETLSPSSRSSGHISRACSSSPTGRGACTCPCSPGLPSPSPTPGQAALCSTNLGVQISALVRLVPCVMALWEATRAGKDGAVEGRGGWQEAQCPGHTPPFHMRRFYCDSRALSVNLGAASGF